MSTTICIKHSHTVMSLKSSIHGVLFQQKRLENASEAVNAQIRIAEIIAELVPCHLHSHSEGMTTVRRTCPSGTLAWRVGGGWRNGDAVVQPPEWLACIAHTDNSAPTMQTLVHCQAEFVRAYPQRFPKVAGLGTM